MAGLTKELILAARDRTCKKVSIPDWGIVYVSAMSGTDRDAWNLHVLQKSKEDSFPYDGTCAFLLVRTLSDENANRLFQDGEEGELNDALPGRVLEQLFNEARDFNGLGVKDAEDDTAAADAGER